MGDLVVLGGDLSGGVALVGGFVIFGGDP